MAMTSDAVLEIEQLALNAREGAQLDDPLNYEHFSCIARTLDADQAFWSNLLPIAPKHGTAFVLETRLGAISCGLARHFSHVVSWHKTSTAATLTRQLADKQQISNVEVLVAQDVREIELPNKSVDTLVFFGPSRDLTGQWDTNIELLLASTLDHFKDALSDLAVILVGENNRWSYRTETPEYPGSTCRGGIALPPLRRKLKTRFPHDVVFVCGFSLASSQSPMPDFLKHDLLSKGLVIPKNRTAIIKDKLLNRPEIRLFWPSFLLISSKKSWGSFAKDLLCQQQIVSKVGWRAAETVTIKRIVAGNSGTSIAIGGPEHCDTADVVLRMPSRAASVSRCQINASALVRLENSPMSRLVPRLVSQGNYLLREYTVETRCTGFEIGYGTRDLDEMIAQACIAIGKMHFETTALTGMDAAHVSTLVSPYIADIRSHSSPEIRTRLDKLAESLYRRMNGISVALGFVHGDFKVSNMLFDRAGTLTAVIDWDGFSEHGFQTFDYLTLLIYKIANERRISLTEAYIEYILPWTLNASDATLVNDAITRLMVNHESFMLVRIVFWFAFLGDRLGPVCKAHAEWHRRFVMPVLPKLEEILYGLKST